MSIDASSLTSSTATNFIGNGVATIVVSAWEGELDRSALSRGLSRTVDTSDIEEAVTTG